MTDKQQPKALRIADELEEPMTDFPEPTTLEAEAAAELRRQHAENARLVALVDAQQPAPSAAVAQWCDGCNPENCAGCGGVKVTTDYDAYGKHGIPLYTAPQPSPAAQGDALDAGRWRRLVNASELSFPVATIADDPENGAVMLYGRKALEDFVDRMDEIPNTYDAARAARVPANSVLEDATFEAVRKKLCALPRYSFVLDDGLVRRVLDRSGNWIAFDDAHELFDPVAVDAVRKQGAKHDNT